MDIDELENLQFDTILPANGHGCILWCYVSDTSLPSGRKPASREILEALIRWMKLELKIRDTRAFDECLHIGPGKIRFVPHADMPTSNLHRLLDSWKHGQLVELYHHTPAPSYGRR